MKIHSTIFTTLLIILVSYSAQQTWDAKLGQPLTVGNNDKLFLDISEIFYGGGAGTDSNTLKSIDFKSGTGYYQPLVVSPIPNPQPTLLPYLLDGATCVVTSSASTLTSDEFFVVCDSKTLVHINMNPETEELQVVKRTELGLDAASGYACTSIGVSKDEARLFVACRRIDGVDVFIKLVGYSISEMKLAGQAKEIKTADPVLGADFQINILKVGDAATTNAVVTLFNPLPFQAGGFVEGWMQNWTGDEFDKDAMKLTKDTIANYPEASKMVVQIESEGNDLYLITRTTAGSGAFQNAYYRARGCKIDAEAQKLTCQDEPKQTVAVTRKFEEWPPVYVTIGQTTDSSRKGNIIISTTEALMAGSICYKEGFKQTTGVSHLHVQDQDQSLAPTRAFWIRNKIYQPFTIKDKKNIIFVINSNTLTNYVAISTLGAFPPGKIFIRKNYLEATSVGVFQGRNDSGYFNFIQDWQLGIQVSNQPSPTQLTQKAGDYTTQKYQLLGVLAKDPATKIASKDLTVKYLIKPFGDLSFGQETQPAFGWTESWVHLTTFNDKIRGNSPTFKATFTDAPNADLDIDIRYAGDLPVNLSPALQKAFETPIGELTGSNRNIIFGAVDNKIMIATCDLENKRFGVDCNEVMFKLALDKFQIAGILNGFFTRTKIVAVVEGTNTESTKQECAIVIGEVFGEVDKVLNLGDIQVKQAISIQKENEVFVYVTGKSYGATEKAKESLYYTSFDIDTLPQAIPALKKVNVPNVEGFCSKDMKVSTSPDNEIYSQFIISSNCNKPIIHKLDFNPDSPEEIYLNESITLDSFEQPKMCTSGNLIHVADLGDNDNQIKLVTLDSQNRGNTYYNTNLNNYFKTDKVNRVLNIVCDSQKGIVHLLVDVGKDATKRRALINYNGRDPTKVTNRIHSVFTVDSTCQNPASLFKYNTDDLILICQVQSATTNKMAAKGYYINANGPHIKVDSSLIKTPTTKKLNLIMQSGPDATKFKKKLYTITFVAPELNGSIELLDKNKKLDLTIANAKEGKDISLEDWFVFKGPITEVTYQPMFTKTGNKNKVLERFRTLSDTENSWSQIKAEYKGIQVMDDYLLVWDDKVLKYFQKDKNGKPVQRGTDFNLGDGSVLYSDLLRNDKDNVFAFTYVLQNNGDHYVVGIYSIKGVWYVLKSKPIRDFIFKPQFGKLTTPLLQRPQYMMVTASNKDGYTIQYYQMELTKDAFAVSNIPSVDPTKFTGPVKDFTAVVVKNHLVIAAFTDSHSGTYFEALRFPDEIAPAVKIGGEYVQIIRDPPGESLGHITDNYGSVIHCEGYPSEAGMKPGLNCIVGSSGVYSYSTKIGLNINQNVPTTLVDKDTSTWQYSFANPKNFTPTSAYRFSKQSVVVFKNNNAEATGKTVLDSSWLLVLYENDFKTLEKTQPTAFAYLTPKDLGADPTEGNMKLFPTIEYKDNKVELTINTGNKAKGVIVMSINPFVFQIKDYAQISPSKDNFLIKDWSATAPTFKLSGLSYTDTDPAIDGKKKGSSWLLITIIIVLSIVIIGGGIYIYQKQNDENRFVEDFEKAKDDIGEGEDKAQTLLTDSEFSRM